MISSGITVSHRMHSVKISTLSEEGEGKSVEQIWRVFGAN